MQRNTVGELVESVVPAHGLPQPGLVAVEQCGGITVTHASSGMALGMPMTLRTAKQFAERLATLDIDWTSPAEKLAKRLLPAHRQQIMQWAERD